MNRVKSDAFVSRLAIYEQGQEDLNFTFQDMRMLNYLKECLTMSLLIDKQILNELKFNLIYFENSLDQLKILFESTKPKGIDEQVEIVTNNLSNVISKDNEFINFQVRLRRAAEAIPSQLP